MEDQRDNTCSERERFELKMVKSDFFQAFLQGETMMNELWPHRVLATGPASARKRISEVCGPPPGDSNFRGFSCWDQLLAMAFAQLTYRESLRDSSPACVLNTLESRR